jgi:hypothetical protein
MKQSKRLDYVLVFLIVLGTVMSDSGVRMNQFVIAQNQGKMPVINWDGRATNVLALYQNATSETKYVYLSDRQNWFGLSIGDLIMYVGGGFIVLVCAILLLRKEGSNGKR